MSTWNLVAAYNPEDCNLPKNIELSIAASQHIKETGC